LRLTAFEFHLSILASGASLGRVSVGVPVLQWCLPDVVDALLLDHLVSSFADLPSTISALNRGSLASTWVVTPTGGLGWRVDTLAVDLDGSAVERAIAIAHSLGFFLAAEHGQGTSARIDGLQQLGRRDTVLAVDFNFISENCFPVGTLKGTSGVTRVRLHRADVTLGHWW